MTVDQLKLGRYSMLRLLTIVYAADPEGITTRRLLEQIGTHETYTKRSDRQSRKGGYIKRMEGKRAT